MWTLAFVFPLGTIFNFPLFSSSFPTPIPISGHRRRCHRRPVVPPPPQPSRSRVELELGPLTLSSSSVAPASNSSNKLCTSFQNPSNRAHREQCIDICEFSSSCFFFSSLCALKCARCEPSLVFFTSSLFSLICRFRAARPSLSNTNKFAREVQRVWNQLFIPGIF